MGYIITHFWFWLLLAFLAGSVVGWTTCGRERR